MYKIKLLGRSKLGQHGFGVIGLLVVVAVIGLIATSGWLVYKHHSSQSISNVLGPAGGQHFDFFGHTITQANCSEVGKFAKVSFPKDHQDGYVCYYTKFALDGENVQYVSIQLTAAYSSTLKEKCGFDCGGSPPSPEVQQGEAPVRTFIQRADGSKEDVSGVGGGSNETIVSELSGCGMNTSSHLSQRQQAGKLVIYKFGSKSKVGVLSDIKDLAGDDNFGNKCLVHVVLVQSVDSSEPDLAITHLTVHYTLQDPGTCNAQTAPSQIASCFTSQATIRDDISFCHQLKSLQPIGPVYEDQCISSLAKRRLDDSLCKQLNYSQSVPECLESIKRLKSAYSGKLEVI
jgi:hypothetical protein